MCDLDCAMQRCCPKPAATSSSANDRRVAIVSSHGSPVFNDTSVIKNKQKRHHHQKHKALH